jgi:hypothetical protein
MKSRLALALFIALLAVVAGRHAGGAQTSVDVRSNTAQSQFPNGIAFQIDIAATGSVDDVRLVYEIAPDGVRATAQPACTSGTDVSCSFLLPSGGSSVLIPGAEVTYFWRITIGGATQETEHRVATYEDSRFDWQTISDGNVTLWYESGSESDARAVLTAARASIGRISALLQTTVAFPVKVFYYGSTRDMQEAIPTNNEQGVITLGEVVFSDTAMVAADYSPEDIARHEVAHIVVRQAIQGPFSVPDWLNEGTAVFAQSQPLSDQRAAIEAAIASGNVLSVRSISSASAGASSDTVSLFYGESWSLVKYLVDTYGDQKFAELFRVFKDGANTGDALQRVYGFNQDGLENAWRASVGLPPRTAPTPNGAAQPTPNPTAGDTPAPGGGGAKIGLIVIIALVTAVLAGGTLAIGFVLARRLR